MIASGEYKHKFLLFIGVLVIFIYLLSFLVFLPYGDFPGSFLTALRANLYRYRRILLVVNISRPIKIDAEDIPKKWRRLVVSKNSRKLGWSPKNRFVSQEQLAGC